MGVQAGDSSVPSLTQREMERRQQKIADAGKRLSEAESLSVAGKHDEAAKLLLETYQTLPEAPIAKPARDRVLVAYATESCAWAQDLLKQGRQKEALEVLDAVLDEDPHNEAVLKLKKHAADPDRYPPALTPTHIANTKQVQKLLVLAGSATDLGDYDKAKSFYLDVLRIDAYNIAARRGMERLEQHKAEYLDAARDQARAKHLNTVSSQWEAAVPPATDLTGMFTGANGVATNAVAKGGRELIERKLRELTLPRVEFAGASLDEVVEYLRVTSRNVDPEGRGISFVVNVDEESKTRTMTLNVQNMPLEELLRYVTQITGTSYRTDDHAVIITSLSAKSTSLITKKYRVPPDFIQKAEVNDGAAAASDPFAAKPADGGGQIALRRMGAKEFLEGRGVVFPEGGGASFSPSSSTLIVRTTADNLNLVDLLVEQAQGNVVKQAKISVKLIEINEDTFRELGFDVAVGAMNIAGSNRVFGSGGTNDPAGTGGLPLMTTGLRSSASIMATPGVDELIRSDQDFQSTTLPPSTQFALRGVMTDPQFALTVRALHNTKGVDLTTVPSIVTKSGQKASIYATREFPYPTEFDPPQIPQQLNSSTTAFAFVPLNPLAPLITGSASSSGAPIVPTTPTAFEKKDLGVILEVEPNISEDGRTVEVALSPSITEFEGFINYGSDITNSIGTSSTLTIGTLRTVTTPPSYTQPNNILQPVFKKSGATTTVNIYDGSTVVFGGLVDERTTDIQDKVPVVGDIPLIGRFWQSKVKQVRKKCILFYVTVNVIDPGGQPVNNSTAAAR